MSFRPIQRHTPMSPDTPSAGTTGGPTAADPMTADGAGTIPWEEARARLAEAPFYWMATRRPDGAPHVRPVLAVWVDGALHFSSSPAARKARNLVADSRCTFSVSTEGLDLVVEGTAARVEDGARLGGVAATYGSKYGWPATVVDGAFDAPYGAPTAGPPPYEVYEVTPQVVFGFGTDEALAPRSTRWRF